MTSRILLLTYGSRGDVEPFVALALGLKRTGFEVSLATAARFQDFVEGFGIAFHPLPDDALALIETPDGKAMIEGASGRVRRIAAGARLARQSAPINARMMEAAWHVAGAVRPDLIVFHPKVMAAPHIAEALRIPAAMATLQPLIVPTRAFPASLRAMPIPGYNRLTYRLVGLSYAAFRGKVNRFRGDVLGLGPIRSGREVLLPRALGDVPVLHAISPAVLPRPADWPDHAHMTGYWRLPEERTDLPEGLDAFLGAGPPPVFVGFGSMTSADPATLSRIVREALESTDQRAVVSEGWAGLNVTDSARVFAVPPMPFGALFPKMAAVVHHGGAGTTAEGFHAGVPQVICPFFGDQPFWAERSVALGVGAPPVPRRIMTADRLAASIRIAVEDGAMQRKAANLAEELHREDGVAEAVRILSALVRT